MEFSLPIPKQSENLGEFSTKWHGFINQFNCYQDASGQSKTSFLLHYGAQSLKGMHLSNKLSHEELPRFITCIETLETHCLFQIVLCFLRHLFFTHCRNEETSMETFYTELSLLSDCCNFEHIVKDDLIKNHLINSINDKSVKDLLLAYDNLNARNVVDLFDISKKQEITITLDLINTYLMEQQQKLLSDTLTKPKKGFSWTPLHFPDTNEADIVDINLNSLFRSETSWVVNASKPLPDLGMKHDMNLLCSNIINNDSTTANGKVTSDSSILAIDKISTGCLTNSQTHTNETVTNFDPCFEPTTNIDVFQESQYQHRPVTATIDSTVDAETNEVEVTGYGTRRPMRKHVNNSSVDISCQDCGNDIVISDTNINGKNVYDIDDNEDANYTNDSNLLVQNEESNIINKGVVTNVVDCNNKQKHIDSKKDISYHDTIDNDNVKEIDANEIPGVFVSQQRATLKTSQIMGVAGQALDVFSCNFCAYTCTGKTAIDEHAMQAHESLKCFVCTACNSKFPSKDQIDSHVRIKHLNIEEHKCQLCDMILASQAKLFQHLQEHAEMRTFLCTDCKSTFTTEKLLSEHMSSHSDMSVICKICCAKFHTRKALSDHVFESHNDACKENPSSVLSQKRIVCTLCDVTFTDKKSFVSHNRKFHGKKGLKEHPCHQCNHVSNSKSNLISHLRTHSGEKPYMCDICGKEFAQSSSLDKHMRIHTGESPYKCQYCDSSFKTSSNRLVHERIHRKERPYICEQCGKTYRNSYELKQHIQTHNEFRTKQFICYCGSGFHTKKKLKRHEVCHIGEKPYKCDICGAGFTRPENVKAHQRSQACRNRVLKLQA